MADNSHGNTDRETEKEKTDRLCEMMYKDCGSEFVVSIGNGSLMAMSKSYYSKIKPFDIYTYGICIIKQVGEAALALVTPGTCIGGMGRRHSVKQEKRSQKLENIDARYMDKVIVIHGGEHIDRPASEIERRRVQGLGDDDIVSLGKRLSQKHYKSTFRDGLYGHASLIETCCMKLNDEIIEGLFEWCFPKIPIEKRADYLLYITGADDLMLSLAINNLLQNYNTKQSSSSSASLLSDNDMDYNVYISPKTFRVDVDNKRLNTENDDDHQSSLPALMCPLYIGMNDINLNKTIANDVVYGRGYEMNKQLTEYHASFLKHFVTEKEKCKKLPADKFIGSMATAFILEKYPTPYDITTNIDGNNDDLPTCISLLKRLQLISSLVNEEAPDIGNISRQDKTTSQCMTYLTRRQISFEHMRWLREDSSGEDFTVQNTLISRQVKLENIRKIVSLKNISTPEALETVELEEAMADAGMNLLQVMDPDHIYNVESFRTDTGTDPNIKCKDIHVKAQSTTCRDDHKLTWIESIFAKQNYNIFRLKRLVELAVFILREKELFSMSVNSYSIDGKQQQQPNSCSSGCNVFFSSDKQSCCPCYILKRALCHLLYRRPVNNADVNTVEKLICINRDTNNSKTNSQYQSYRVNVSLLIDEKHSKIGRMGLVRIRHNVRKDVFKRNNSNTRETGSKTNPENANISDEQIAKNNRYKQSVSVSDILREVCNKTKLFEDVFNGTIPPKNQTKSTDFYRSIVDKDEDLFSDVNHFDHDKFAHRMIEAHFRELVNPTIMDTSSGLAAAATSSPVIFDMIVVPDTSTRRFRSIACEDDEVEENDDKSINNDTEKRAFGLMFGQNNEPELQNRKRKAVTSAAEEEVVNIANKEAIDCEKLKTKGSDVDDLSSVDDGDDRNDVKRRRLVNFMKNSSMVPSSSSSSLNNEIINKSNNCDNVADDFDYSNFLSSCILEILSNDIENNSKCKDQVMLSTLEHIRKKIRCDSDRQRKIDSFLLNSVTEIINDSLVRYLEMIIDYFNDVFNEVSKFLNLTTEQLDSEFMHIINLDGDKPIRSVVAHMDMENGNPIISRSMFMYLYMRLKQDIECLKVKRPNDLQNETSNIIQTLFKLQRGMQTHIYKKASIPLILCFVDEAEKNKDNNDHYPLIKPVKINDHDTEVTDFALPLQQKVKHDIHDKIFGEKSATKPQQNSGVGGISSISHYKLPKPTSTGLTSILQHGGWPQPMDVLSRQFRDQKLKLAIFGKEGFCPHMPNNNTALEYVNSYYAKRIYKSGQRLAYLPTIPAIMKHDMKNIISNVINSVKKLPDTLCTIIGDGYRSEVIKKAISDKLCQVQNDFPNYLSNVNSQHPNIITALHIINLMSELYDVPNFSNKLVINLDLERAQSMRTVFTLASLRMRSNGEVSLTNEQAERYNSIQTLFVDKQNVFPSYSSDLPISGHSYITTNGRLVSYDSKMGQEFYTPLKLFLSVTLRMGPILLRMAGDANTAEATINVRHPLTKYPRIKYTSGRISIFDVVDSYHIDDFINAIQNQVITIPNLVQYYRQQLSNIDNMSYDDLLEICKELHVDMLSCDLAFDKFKLMVFPNVWTELEYQIEESNKQEQHDNEILQANP